MTIFVSTVYQHHVSNRAPILVQKKQKEGVKWSYLAIVR